MSFEPVLFDSTMFETANEAFLFCKGHLEKKGHLTAATQLGVLAPINTKMLGQLALQALYEVRPLLEDREYVDMAIDTLVRALERPTLLSAQYAA